jgi:hypothetical protein
MNTISKQPLAAPKTNVLLFPALNAEIRTISKTDVLFVNKGSIHEISFVKAGAVKQTHAVIADADKCEPLWSDCKSLKFELTPPKWRF